MKRKYLISVPERVVRSAAAIAGGLAREIGDLTLPAAVRRTRLYKALVADTLRFLIEQVGEVRGAYPEDGALSENFAVRRAAGNGIEWAGILAFRASPVWVLAALADVSGAGRQIVREVADSLKAEGLLERGGQFENLDQILDGLERTAGRAADAINTPPIDVAGLRAEWAAIRDEAKTIPLPRVDAAWQDLKLTAAQQGRSIFEVSSLIAVNAIGRTGRLCATALLEHYRDTLAEIRRTGYLAYWVREFRPYLRAAAAQFLPRKRTLTERLLG